MSDYKILTSKKDYSNPFFDVQKEIIQYPNGIENTYYTLKKGYGFVAIFAIENDKLLLLKQCRPSLLDWLYEIPMGGIDQGETPLEAAKREFLEEAGHEAEKWQELGQLFVGAGHTDQLGHYFLATDLQKIENGAQNNPKEIIEVNHFSFKEIDQMILNGKFQDGPSLSALALYRVYNRNNKL
jgi:ADP-ribose pyrophosphatase